MDPSWESILDSLRNKKIDPWGPRFCQFRQLEEVPKCSLCGGPRVFECQVHWCWWRERFGQFGMENILGFDYVVSGSIMSCIVLPCKGFQADLHFRREWLMAPQNRMRITLQAHFWCVLQGKRTCEETGYQCLHGQFWHPQIPPALGCHNTSNDENLEWSSDVDVKSL